MSLVTTPSYYNDFRFTVDDEYRTNIMITAKKSLSVNVRLRTTCAGRVHDYLRIVLVDLETQIYFEILRNVQAIIGNVQLYEELKPKTTYTPRARVDVQPITMVVPSVPPPNRNSIPYVTQLPQAHIPETLKRQLSTLKFIPDLPPSALCSASYSRFFELLLWIEEFQLE